MNEGRAAKEEETKCRTSCVCVGEGGCIEQRGLQAIQYY